MQCFVGQVSESVNVGVNFGFEGVEHIWVNSRALIFISVVFFLYFFFISIKNEQKKIN